MQTMVVEGVTVQVVEAEFDYVGYGFRPSSRRKQKMYCAQRPNGTWESMCPTPQEAVSVMRMMQEMKK